jgi:negative regulator of sigma-B (phosphoserine phosphatase)
MNGAALEWSAALRPKPGEASCGDRALVADVPSGAIAAAIDGLGHGPEAEIAAETAIGVIKRFADDDVALLTERCHVALRQTRGAALTISFFDRRSDTMTWAGVGNVEGLLVPTEGSASTRESLLPQVGIVGDELPSLSATTIPVRRGDVLLMATDGVRAEFADTVVVSGTCEEIAEGILRRYALATDDALVLAARYLGTAGDYDDR